MNGLCATGVSLALGNQPILCSVDLALRRGEVTAIVGPNGAGKSTLMTCLAALRRPDRGGVSLDGLALSTLKHRERARRIGYLPQAPEIAWRLDVETFVRLGRTAHRGVFGESPDDAAAVARALDATGMTAFTDRDVTTLSGGERARVLIARVLAGEPDWLLADEPLTGLDPRHQLDAAQTLRAFAEAGGGVAVTLHDLSFAAQAADRVVVMADGAVIADGAPAQALSPETLARAYGIDARWVPGARGPLLDILGRHD